ncbi:MAG TPA: Gfo/Idh/MocA family oxidoreductase [Candidatus Dormibacteraeota bacterium]|nr:Gfo/Idh/MocA family oxidoreductase [Candidatus Dormibacteraeota bacterium]
MDEIGVALLGYGLAGSVFHAPLIAATQGLRLRAVVTNDPRRKLQVERDFPQVRSVPTLEGLLQDAADIGLVVIATPNHMHLSQATAALAQGLHVVVDKPMALSSAEASAMIAAAQRSGRLLSVFQNRRFDNDYLLVRQLIADHRIEAVRHFESRFERWRPELRPASWREEQPPEEGGGLLLDLGSHLIDQALLLFGRPLAVYAELATRRQGAQADDDCFIALSFEGGMSAHLWMSAVAPCAGPRFRIFGNSAALEVWGLDPQESQLASGLRPGQIGFGHRGQDQSAELIENGGRPGTGKVLPFPAGSYATFYRTMAEAIRGEAEVPVAPEEAASVLRVIEGARTSAAGRKPVTTGV